MDASQYIVFTKTYRKSYLHLIQEIIPHNGYYIRLVFLLLEKERIQMQETIHRKREVFSDDTAASF